MERIKYIGFDMDYTLVGQYYLYRYTVSSGEPTHDT